MKLNKWTAGLTALGVVSLASVASADEKGGSVLSASSTVLSGYVDTSAQWNIGDGQSSGGGPANSHAPAYKYGGAAKSDGFNLDAVVLTLEKPLDESEWAAGYRVDLMLGPDANVLGTTSSRLATSDFAIEQAYVLLNAPVGTGLDFKIGVFDSILGYESTQADKNPNWTRSWGHTFEPAVLTGVLTTYHINSSIALSGGVADTDGATINARSTVANGTTSESYKAYMAALALTAPDDWGFLAGSSLDGGFINGQNNLLGGPQFNAYAGVTMNTPVTGLRAGFSWDYARIHLDVPIPIGATVAPAGTIPAALIGTQGATAHSFAAYASYQVPDTKLSVHERIEYADLSGGVASLAQSGGAAVGGGIPSSVLSITSTLQYDLWKNVLSRIEFRWDRDLSGVGAFGGSVAPFAHGGYIQSGTAENEFIVAANFIYKF